MVIKTNARPLSIRRKIRPITNANRKGSNKQNRRNPPNNLPHKPKIGYKGNISQHPKPIFSSPRHLKVQHSRQHRQRK